MRCFRDRARRVQWRYAADAAGTPKGRNVHVSGLAAVNRVGLLEGRISRAEAWRTTIEQEPWHAVPRAMKSSAALAHIRQLCNLGLGSEAVMPALLRSVRQLVRADSAAYFWVDARGEMSNMYAERMLVVASTEGEIATASYRAYALLAHASGEPINRESMAGSVDRASRDLLKKLAHRLSGGGLLPDAPPALTVENNWGRFRLRAYSLSQFEMGVLIQRQEHLVVRVADAMLDLPLSAQQREVALLLAQGMTNNEIATAMGVSINTASYHVKQLFQKLDAHDRGEAIARILDGHNERNR